jgi:D-3-phosphoglycerate dehydrogenase
VSQKRVVVIDGGYETYAVETKLLAEAGCEFELFPGDRHDLEGKLAFAKDAAGMFVRWSELGGAEFDKIPSVKCIVRYGIGYDNINLPDASERKIKVCNVQGYANHAVSDHALSLILACVRSLPMGMATLRSNYAAPPRRHMPEFKDLTLGIVGLGRIGGTLCAKAKSLFQRVLAYDPYITDERFASLGAEKIDFDALLRESDVISVHCNLTDETKLMFNADAFGRMREDAVLVNTSRGPVVDEDAITDALESSRLFAAGLDVFWDEPPLENRERLTSLPNVIATGHYAWYSDAAHKELQRRAAENMTRMLKGETPDDCLNREAFE